MSWFGKKEPKGQPVWVPGNPMTGGDFRSNVHVVDEDDMRVQISFLRWGCKKREAQEQNAAYKRAIKVLQQAIEQNKKADEDVSRETEEER